jgi:type IX secretion system PorP/SprF family membrane protein
VLEEDNMRFWVPDFGFGVLYTGSMYWVGLSVPGFFGFETNETGRFALKAGPEYLDFYLSGGANLKFNPDWGLEPSLMLQYNPVFTPQVTINALGVFKDAYRAGFGYRHKEAIIMLVSISINRQFAVGYSYDLNIGETSDYTSGSHEINVHYKFGYKVNASNPRGF